MFDEKLSLKIDYLIYRLERSRGIKRWIMAIKLWWAERKI